MLFVLWVNSMLSTVGHLVLPIPAIWPGPLCVRVVITTKSSLYYRPQISHSFQCFFFCLTGYPVWQLNCRSRIYVRQLITLLSRRFLDLMSHLCCIKRPDFLLMVLFCRKTRINQICSDRWKKATVCKSRWLVMSLESPRIEARQNVKLFTGKGPIQRTRIT